MAMIFETAHRSNRAPRGQQINASAEAGTRQYGWLGAILILTTGLCASLAAQAAIPASERQALLDLYTSTNGGDWTDDSGWNGAPGTECMWYGITCADDASHVTEIDLYANHLTGSLPDIFGDLGHAVYLDLSYNQLAGSVPTLTGLTNIRYFYIEINHLTGSIPSLAGLTNLESFEAFENELTGPIPSLVGLTNLDYFSVGYNQLTGPIPSLAGLTNLHNFYVEFNELNGTVPSLANLTNLTRIRLNDNQLSGAMPAAPSPSMLDEGSSQLCSNHLDPIPNADWDAATGETPWYQNCTPLLDDIFADGFDP